MRRNAAGECRTTARKKRAAKPRRVIAAIVPAPTRRNSTARPMSVALVICTAPAPQTRNATLPPEGAHDQLRAAVRWSWREKLVAIHGRRIVERHGTVGL